MTTKAEKKTARLSRRARLWAALAVGGALVLGVLVTFLIVRPLSDVQKDVKGIRPNVELGKNVCSGGNTGACDRVCLATSARLVVKDRQGNVLLDYCVRSTVTSKPGSPKTTGISIHRAPGATTVITPDGSTAPPGTQGPVGPQGPSGPSGSDGGGAPTPTVPAVPSPPPTPPVPRAPPVSIPPICVAGICTPGIHLDSMPSGLISNLFANP